MYKNAQPPLHITEAAVGFLFFVSYFYSIALFPDIVTF